MTDHQFRNCFDWREWTAVLIIFLVILIVQIVIILVIRTYSAKNFFIRTTYDITSNNFCTTYDCNFAFAYDRVDEIVAHLTSLDYVPTLLVEAYRRGVYRCVNTEASREKCMVQRRGEYEYDQSTAQISGCTDP